MTGLASASLACEGLRPGPTGRVVEVTDGDTLVLASGLVVRLIGTQAPKLPLGRDGFDQWPLAAESKAALEALVLGREVELRYGGESVDRYERALAHVFVPGEPEIWAQGEMVAQGMARVYSFPDNRMCLDLLMTAEAEARTERRGIWPHPFYQVRAAEPPNALAGRVGQYELVEGRVLAAERVSGRVFLNFGRVFREDFTAVIEAPALRLFAAAGRDPLDLEDALVRIRGWIDSWDGPRIEVTHPEQIEVLARR